MAIPLGMRGSGVTETDDTAPGLLLLRGTIGHARHQLGRDGPRTEDRADPRPRQPGGGSAQAAARAHAVLHDHQRGHRPDPADRHGRPADRRQRARGKAVCRERRRERRTPPRGRVEQHAVLRGAVAHRRSKDRRKRASCCSSTRATDRTCCSRCSARTVEDPREGTGVVSVLRNITDLRRATEQIEENYQKLRVAEAAVRAERDRLNLIIDSVADPIIVTDSDRRDGADERPGRGSVHAASERQRHGAAHRAGQRRALLVVHLRPAARRDRARARSGGARSG